MKIRLNIINSEKCECHKTNVTFHMSNTNFLKKCQTTYNIYVLKSH